MAGLIKTQRAPQRDKASQRKQPERRGKTAAHPQQLLEAPETLHPDAVLSAQQQLGNQVVQRALEDPTRRKGAGNISDPQGNLREDISASIQQERGSGSPLPKEVQAEASQTLGHNFEHVRIHTDSKADVLSRSIRARAFTIGSDIFFKGGVFSPASGPGRETLIHELTHVVQQSGSHSGGRLKLGPPGNTMEREAERMGKKAASAVTGKAQGGAVQRSGEEEEEIQTQEDEEEIQTQPEAGMPAGAIQRCGEEEEIQTQEDEEEIQTQPDLGMVQREDDDWETGDDAPQQEKEPMPSRQDMMARMHDLVNVMPGFEGTRKAPEIVRTGKKFVPQVTSDPKAGFGSVMEAIRSRGQTPPSVESPSQSTEKPPLPPRNPPPLPPRNSFTPATVPGTSQTGPTIGTRKPPLPPRNPPPLPPRNSFTPATVPGTSQTGPTIGTRKPPLPPRNPPPLPPRPFKPGTLSGGEQSGVSIGSHRDTGIPTPPPLPEMSSSTSSPKTGGGDLSSEIKSKANALVPSNTRFGRFKSALKRKFGKGPKDPGAKDTLGSERSAASEKRAEFKMKLIAKIENASTSPSEADEAQEQLKNMFGDDAAKGALKNRKNNLKKAAQSGDQTAYQSYQTENSFLGKAKYLYGKHKDKIDMVMPLIKEHGPTVLGGLKSALGLGGNASSGGGGGGGGGGSQVVNINGGFPGMGGGGGGGGGGGSGMVEMMQEYARLKAENDELKKQLAAKK